jgi:DNA-binding NarL/FixJ family response regulator
MRPLSVIVAQSNAKTGEFLTQSLYDHFRVVHTAGNLNELLHSIPKHRADVAVVDLELADLEGVRQLAHQFSSTKIVCTHRLADEKMWTDALAAGAADCCNSSDVRAIVLAAGSVKPISHAHAA